MAKNQNVKLVANPSATFRAMGEDLVVVNEDEGKLVVLNATAKTILDGILENITDTTIARRLMRTFELKDGTKKSLALIRTEIDSTRDELFKAGILVKSRPFVKPEVTVRDLKAALVDMDLTNSTVSQYE